METLWLNYTFWVVATGAGLLGVLSGALGCFALLRKQSLLGDGVSHAAFPGVVLAFLLTGSKEPEILLLGGVIMGLIATFLMGIIAKHSPIPFDSALAVVLAVFFGFGMVLLSYLQKNGSANQSGLSQFIYGQASTIMAKDIWRMGICGIIITLLLWLFWKEFKVLTFDPTFAKTLGIAILPLEWLLTLMLVTVILLGLQTVGVILMSAMLIAPAVAAKQWVNQLGAMVMLSAFFGGISAILGTAISTSQPQLSTGPVIVVCATGLAFVSLWFAPKKGMVYTLLSRKQNKWEKRDT